MRTSPTALGACLRRKSLTRQTLETSKMTTSLRRASFLTFLSLVSTALEWDPTPTMASKSKPYSYVPPSCASPDPKLRSRPIQARVGRVGEEVSGELQQKRGMVCQAAAMSLPSVLNSSSCHLSRTLRSDRSPACGVAVAPATPTDTDSVQRALDPRPVQSRSIPGPLQSPSRSQPMSRPVSQNLD